MQKLFFVLLTILIFSGCEYFSGSGKSVPADNYYDTPIEAPELSDAPNARNMDYGSRERIDDQVM